MTKTRLQKIRDFLSPSTKSKPQNSIQDDIIEDDEDNHENLLDASFDSTVIFNQIDRTQRIGESREQNANSTSTPIPEDSHSNNTNPEKDDLDATFVISKSNTELNESNEKSNEELNESKEIESGKLDITFDLDKSGGAIHKIPKSQSQEILNHSQITPQFEKPDASPHTASHIFPEIKVVHHPYVPTNVSTIPLDGITKLSQSPLKTTNRKQTEAQPSITRLSQSPPKTTNQKQTEAQPSKNNFSTSPSKSDKLKQADITITHDFTIPTKTMESNVEQSQMLLEAQSQQNNILQDLATSIQMLAKGKQDNHSHNMKWVAQLAPTFCGRSEENFCLWQNRVFIYFNFLGFTEGMKLNSLPILLQDRAFTFYSTLDEKDKTTFDQAMTSLENKFGPTAKGVLFQTSILNYHQSGSVSEYSTKLADKLAMLKITDESQKMNAFLRGLKPEIASSVILMKPIDYNECENAALLVEATQSFKNDDSIKELRNAVASLTLALQDRPDSDETAQIQALLPNKQSSSDQNQYQRRPQFQSTQINNSSQPYNQPTRPAFRQNYRTNQYNRFDNQSQCQQRPQYRPPNPAYNGPQNNFQEPRFHQQYPYPKQKQTIRFLTKSKF